MTPPQVSDIVPYVDAQGRLTVEGMKLFQMMLAILRDHAQRIEDLEP